MSNEESVGCCGFICGICIGGVLCCFLASDLSNFCWKREAVKHGAAHYEMDPATGKTEWKWNKNEE